MIGAGSQELINHRQPFLRTRYSDGRYGVAVWLPPVRDNHF
jgi:hypothetical protein